MLKPGIFLRQTEDWGHIDENTYPKRFKQKMGGYAPDRCNCFLKNLRIWKRVFKLSYFQFRQGLTDIARTTWDNTGLPLIVGEDYSFDQIVNTPDLILFPTDDDDWFAPNLTDVARSFNDEVQVVIWKPQLFFTLSYRKDVQLVVKDFYRDNKIEAPTNAYAHQTNNLPPKVLENHYQAKVFANHNPRSVFLLDKFYSINVKHIGSFYYLSYNELTETVIQVVRSTVNNWYGKEIPLPKEVFWAREAVDRYQKLMEQLTLS